ncbi:MAG: thioredoxin family protein [Thermoanaerobaculia bacterium]
MERTNQRALPIVLLVVAALLVAARIASYGLAPRSAMLVQWVPLEDAQQLATSLGKPILYDFTADWCEPCHRLDDQVFRNAKLAGEINERFIPVQVVDRRQEEGQNTPDVNALQQRYGVRGFPTIVFATAEGSELARMEGFGGRDAFERVMERAR